MNGSQNEPTKSEHRDEPIKNDGQDEPRAKFFGQIARMNFAHLDKAPFGGRAQTDFFFVWYDGVKYVLKKFGRMENFERELAALESLRHTGRVYDLIFSSRDLDEYRGGETGPYFVVKREYVGLLKNERNPIKLLERAAQEVDISRVFLSQGWRDLDGNFENDAVDKNKVVRIDLDSAHPLWADASKADEGYRTPSDVSAYSKVSEHQNILNQFKDEEELNSLAIRLSRLFLDLGYPDCEEVLSLRDGNWRERLKARLLPLPDLSEKRKRRVRDGWMEHWAKLAVGRWALTRDEAKLLGLLFFKILSDPEHGLTLSDLHQSLMLLNVAALQLRHKLLKVDPRLEELRTLVLELREHERFIPPPPDVPKKADGSAPAVVHELRHALGGNSWAGVKKGTDRVGEDLVLLPEAGRPPVILLADGASTAGGSEAIRVVRSVYSDWVGNVSLKNFSECQKSIEGLVNSIHRELLNRTERCETTLVIMALIEDPVRPSAVFARFGNSSYVLTREKLTADPAGEGGEFRRILHSIEKRETQMLGAAGFTPHPLNEIVAMLLEEGYRYRLRAFSDGVEGEARNQITARADILELVEQAGQWHKTIEEVGHDDWAVAGFDVVVARSDISTAHDEKQAAHVPGEAPDPLERLGRVVPAMFVLSDKATVFWRQALRDHSLRVLSEQPLIQEVVKLPEDGGGTAPGSGRDQSGGRVPSMNLWRVCTALIAIGIILAVVIYIAGRGRDEPPVTSRLEIPSPTPDRPRPRETPRSLSAQGLKIYQPLGSREKYILSRLPGGTAVDSTFDEFLKGMAEVLATTDWTVLIEVYTDSSGQARTAEERAKVNKAASKKRADNILNKLRELNPNAVRENRVQVEGRGDKGRVIEDDRTEVLRAENRRLVVTRTNPQ